MWRQFQANVEGFSFYNAFWGFILLDIKCTGTLLVFENIWLPWQYTCWTEHLDHFANCTFGSFTETVSSLAVTMKIVHSEMFGLCTETGET